jgi:hypothetical protein
MALPICIVVAMRQHIDGDQTRPYLPENDPEKPGESDFAPNER